MSRALFIAVALLLVAGAMAFSPVQVGRGKIKM
jgi:hypothetical protein